MGALDAFIVDIKTADPAIYRSYTGGSNELVFRNLRTLLGSFPRDKIKLRVPLIPDFNDAADQTKTASILRDMGAIHVELFSYKKTN